MGLTPYNPNLGQTIQSEGTECARAFIAHYHIDAGDNPAAALDGVTANVTLSDGATKTVLAAAIDHQLKCARVLNITGNAATAVGNVVITGKDMAGAVITETIVSTGAATVAGAKAFAEITSIVFPARGAEADAIKVGTTDKFGIPFKLARNTVLAIYNNNTATTVAAATVSATVLCSNTLDPTAALADNDIDVYLLV